MDVKNDLSGGKPTLLIAEDEESNYIQMEIDSCIDREQKYNIYLLK